MPEIGAYVHTIRNEVRGKEYDRKGYIYTTMPTVHLPMSSVLDVEQHIILDENHFMDVFVGNCILNPNVRVITCQWRKDEQEFCYSGRVHTGIAGIECLWRPSYPVATEPSEITASTETSATEPPGPEFTAPEGTLVAFPVDAAPTLDGVADDAAWMDAHEVVIPVANGFNNFSTVVSRKAVYGVDTVYFLVSYAGPTESWFHSPWQKQKDGTWKKITDPNDKGCDNNTVYWESRFF